MNRDTQFYRPHQGLQDALFGFEFGVSQDIKNGCLLGSTLQL